MTSRPLTTAEKNQNQTESTAKFQLFFHHRKKTFFHKTNEFFLFRNIGEEREKSKHTLSYVYHSGVCRALKNTTIGRRIRERKKRSSQIFYYYFSTPIFYVGFFIFCIQKEVFFKYTIAFSVVYNRGKIYHSTCINCGIVYRYMLACIYTVDVVKVFVELHESIQARRVKTRQGRKWKIHNFLCLRLHIEGSSFIYLWNPFLLVQSSWMHHHLSKFLSFSLCSRYWFLINIATVCWHAHWWWMEMMVQIIHCNVMMNH